MNSKDLKRFIVLKEVCSNNLKNIDAHFPLNQLTVVTGVSGSGKSSLVFDTLYAESYRRYVESLSSFARQYLKALPKPKLNKAINLPPAIAVQQSRLTGNSRSTVGTMTELNDLLKVIFANLSTVICYNCGEEIVCDTPETIAEKLLKNYYEKSIIISASLEYKKNVTLKSFKAQILSQGFARCVVDGEVLKIENLKAAQLKKTQVVIDRIKINNKNTQRMIEALDLGFKAGRNIVNVILNDKKILQFSSDLRCNKCDIDYFTPIPALFSFNNPYGACKRCQGFGFEPEIDWKKVFPDMDGSLYKKQVSPWNFGSHDEMYLRAKKSAKQLKINYKKPFKNYTSSEMEWLKFGDGKNFGGIKSYFDWLDTKKHKPHYRIHMARYRKYITCSHCNGNRLNYGGLSCYIDNENIADIWQKSILSLIKWINKIENLFLINPLNSYKGFGTKEAIDEFKFRINYLNEIGVGYLSLNRLTRTLSGGEQRRINMARCLGTALTDTLYCLDEPTAGLHAADTDKLLKVLYDFKSQGNSVVVVEHDNSVINGADYLIEVGPKAGHLGGKIIYEGSPKNIKTDLFKFKDKKIEYKNFINLKGARTHNLKNVDIKIPTNAFTVICGVSGSGKTSLIQYTLYPMLADFLGKKPDESLTNYEKPIADAIGSKKNIDKYSDVIFMNQNLLGKSTRSNIGTYLGIFDGVRRFFADEPKARRLGLHPGHFSFNTPEGRCETCKGLGTVIEDLSFLGEMTVTCPSCEGRRFDDKVLSITFRGKNLLDILSMTALELKMLFYDKKSLVNILDEIINMGLGYICLGQTTSSFSGGEAQRLKLLKIMQESRKSGGENILIFDEPTTGLSDFDVKNLLDQFNKLVDNGHMVIVIEHHLGLIKSSDWVIEIGPGAADNGGRVIYEGSPLNLKKASNSITAKFL